MYACKPYKKQNPENYFRFLCMNTANEETRRASIKDYRDTLST